MSTARSLNADTLAAPLLGRANYYGQTITDEMVDEYIDETAREMGWAAKDWPSVDMVVRRIRDLGGKVERRY